MIENALSLDLEEWYHPELVRTHLGNAPRTHRAGRAVEALLDLLERHGHRCTFFLLSDTLQAYPQLVQEILQRGHEIGVHGHTHTMLTEHTPESFDAELKAFMALWEGLGVGARPRGYRAPTFSLNQATSWALEVLERNGFLYDSSIFPIRAGLYGVPGAPLGVYRPDPGDLTRDGGGGILELPMTVAELGPLRLPVSGGFYFRCLPFWLSRRLLASVNAQARPFVFYFHPWEIDPDIPRMRLGALGSFVTYWGLGSMTAKLERLFSMFRFTRIDEVLRI
jgi:polysaccharide deacetylase family protein (PEP-CTERM system associated)